MSTRPRTEQQAPRRAPASANPAARPPILAYPAAGSPVRTGNSVSPLPLHPRADLSPDARAALLAATPDTLQAWLAARGEPAYRANQILAWVYQRGATSFAQMTDLSKTLRDALSAAFVLQRATTALETRSDDGTRKLLLTFADGESVETVWIPSEDRHTACISSQVGCPVGCRFCASGLDGVTRNLSTDEIVEQVLCVRALVESADAAARLSNIVLMGMGEPLANYAAVVHAIRIMNAPWGLGIGARKITLSTVGLPAQIRRLAEEGLPINLALSLHAPDDTLRHKLIPWGKGVPIRDLLEACRYYFEKTGREVTLEYVLLSGVNTAAVHADALARIARQLRANINLLRYNPVPGLPYARPSADEAETFQARLRSHGVTSHIRRSRGRDADAACGQLRRQM